MADFYVNLFGDKKVYTKDGKEVTKDTKIKKKTGFFQTPELFKDGYQFGDVLGTAFGTAVDTVATVGKGAGRLVEGVGDLALYGASEVADLFGADGADRWLKSAARTNVVDNVFAPIDNTFGKSSIWGDRSSSILEGVGQVGGMIATGGIGSAAGLGSLGTTMLTAGTMFASSTGSGLSEAYQSGATDGEAWTYGLLKGGIDAGSEMLFGGLGKFVNALGFSRGISSLDDAFAKKVSGKITNRVLRNATEFGIKASGEGLEEVIAGYGSAVAKKLTYASDKELKELVEDEDLLEQFIAGALTSGIVQSPQLYSTTKNGADFVTGYTKSEESVVESLVQDKVRELESEGKKVSKREISKIYDDVKNSLEKGYIDTDKIESIIGGDEYKSFKDLEKKLEEAEKEYDKYHKMPYGEKSDAIGERQKKLASEIESLKKQVSEAREPLFRTLDDGIKGTRLSESYREGVRASEKFEADLSKYENEFARKTIENYMARNFNNTNRSHDRADFMAKLAEDRSRVYGFTTTAELEASIKEGNPYGIEEGTDVSKIEALESEKNGVILVNMDANKSFNSLIGHETTHTMEKAGLYGDLQEAVFDLAKSRGEYDDRLESIRRRYANLSEDEQMKELTADLLGDYIFASDPEFVMKLSTERPNLFKRILEEIKHLFKLATSGSDEARQLEKARHLFEKAWRDGGKTRTESQNDTRTKFSLETVDDISYVKADRSLFVKEDGTLASERDVFKSLVGETLTLPDGEIEIVKRLPKKDMYNELSRRYPKNLGGIEDVKRLNSDVNYNMKELLENSEAIKQNEEDTDGKHKEQGIVSFDTRTVNFYDGQNAYEIQFSVAALQDGRKVAYAKKFFGYDAELTKKIQASEARSKQSPLNQQPVDNDSIPHSPKNASGKSDIDGSMNEEVKVLEGGTVSKLSLSSWTPETQGKTRENLVTAGYEVKKVDKWIADLNSVASVIASDKGRLDFEAADNQTMLKNNQDYVKTLDASTLCAKRLPYQGTFNAIQHRLPNTVLSSDDLIMLQNMMKEYGYEAPCSVCYVESRRRHLGKFAQEWLDGYNGEYKPNLDEITTSDGLENLRKTHPQTHDDFIKAMKKKGSSNPKVVQLRTEYRNEIMSLTPGDIEKIEAIGGLRVQSFSDFETPHLLDMMQAVMDMSAKGLTSQAYTKVPNFAWVFGDTGIKINLSLIAEGDGFDADGNLAFSSVEGMDINDALALRDAYSSNVGTIIVGANDKHILACMADDRIDFIIPFHRSGWGQVEMDMMGIGSYEDYSYGQNEHDLSSPKKVVKGVQQYAKAESNLYPPDYWDYNLSGKENAERYLNLCAKTGREPKFSNFLVNNGDGTYSLQPDGSTDGYWKTLIDFKMYDNEGNGAKQQKVQPIFNMEEAYRVLNEYEGGANSLPVANDVVEEFVSMIQNRNLAPVDTKYSLADSDEHPTQKASYGYHAGDLGKAEGYWNMASSNRGTGHFGTGTYFVGNEESISDGSYGERPHERVDFSKYNLYRPYSANEGYDLHDALKFLNNNIYVFPISKMSFDERYDIKKKMGDISYELFWNEDLSPEEYEKGIAYLEDIRNKYGYLVDRKLAEKDASEMTRDDYEIFADKGNEIYEKLSDIVSRFHGNRLELTSAMAYRDGLSYEKAEKMYDSVVQEIYDEVSQFDDAYEHRYDDSVSTRFMKKFGYEGIDVRGIKELDNARYGSVIYDLKGEDLARKQEIGTANFRIADDDIYTPKTYGDGLTAKDMLVKDIVPAEDIAPAVGNEATSSETSANEIAPLYAAQPNENVIDGQLSMFEEIPVKKSDEVVKGDSKKSRPEQKQRKWVGTSTESEVVDGKVLPKDLDQDLIHYQPIPNKKTLGNANASLERMGYDTAVQYFNSQFENKKVSLDDIALGERLIQEAVKREDYETASNLIQNVSILGTELGQKVQALSIIKRLSPEGQLKMLQKTVERGKAKGDKAFEGVEITQEMIDHILKTYGKDGTYDQKKLNKAVEEVKQKIADQMKVTPMEKANAWRYLSMLGNPKTHIRNLVSNVAMRGTLAVKNAIARTIEGIAPIKNRTKTWKASSDAVNKFAELTTNEMKDEISGNSKYSDDASIKQKREIFKNKILNGVYEFNSNMLEKEDWWFSKKAFKESLAEYLTANGIVTEQDIAKNPKIVAKAKAYALEQAQIATFRQYSWLANKINEMEKKNTATSIAVGAILPFKKTPVNIAKTGLSYSPLGFMKTLTYDIAQVRKGNMEASELVDHLSQNVTGTALTLVGYMLASSGLLSGGGEDDKEGKYDYQLGEQAYSVNIDGNSYSLSWLSPVAMPLFVGANAYEQLVEGKEWNGDVVVETLSQTLDPLSEMSFLSSLDDVLSSYDSGVEKFAGIAESMAQNYITQFAPTIMSQVATVTDDKKRSTKVGGDSGFKFFDETINKLKYKIPGLRQTLEPSTDIWGNEVTQTENLFGRAFETFIAPYSKRENIATDIDEEIKSVYRETGDNGIIPNVPYNYTNYGGEKYKMSDSEYTQYKQNYGQTASSLLDELFGTETYKASTSEDKAKMINDVYDYAADEAKRELLAQRGIDYTNAESSGTRYYRENPIKGAIEMDISVDEYNFSTANPEKYAFFKDNGMYDKYASADEEGKRAYNWAYENPGKYEVSKVIADNVVEYRQYTSGINDVRADKDENGKTIPGSAKGKKIAFINGLNLDYGQKIILYRSEYSSDDTYNNDIVEYLNNREDISYDEMVTILKELGFSVSSDGTVSW